MDVRVDRVFEESVYRAILEDGADKETQLFGLRMMWRFRLLDENGDVVGFTNMSPSIRANAFQWAQAIMGKIDPKVGWGPQDVIGGECIVVLEITEDAQGVRRTRLSRSSPPSKDKERRRGLPR